MNVLGSLDRFNPIDFKMFKTSALKESLGVWGFGFTKVPMLFFIKPVLTDISETTCTFRVPYKRRNLNHFNSIYFGVLAAGADLAGGFLAMNAVKQSGSSVGLLFKYFKADFLRRPEADTFFTCEDGIKIREAVKEAEKTGERINLPVNVTATCPEKSGDEPVAKFVLTLSLKKRSKK